MFVQPAQEVGLLATSVLLGIFSLGIYPVLLELSVEATYPLDQGVVSGLCNLSHVLQVSLHTGLFTPHKWISEFFIVQSSSQYREYCYNGMG